MEPQQGKTPGKREGKKPHRPQLRYILWLAVGGLALTGAATQAWQLLMPNSNNMNVSSRLGGNNPSKVNPKPNQPLYDQNGWPLLNPAPPEEGEVWECEVAIVGGSLGGISAAYHAMKTGATTCLIELTPMWGGQVSSQGVSAIDESLLMRYRDLFPTSWKYFKNLIADQPAFPEKYSYLKPGAKVADTNSCWVGHLCFTPYSGSLAAEKLLEEGKAASPKSRWSTQVAFKGASFSSDGRTINTVYGVKRTPKDANYIPQGRLSREIKSWYNWNSDEVFDKKTIRIQAPNGKRMIVIDATDTGEVIGWANVPHRLGSEGFVTTGEKHAVADNPECTQAFTFPFVLKIFDDKGESLRKLQQVKPGYSREEHRRNYDLGRFPMFVGNSVFNYRRIISMKRDDPFKAIPAPGDMTVVNWNPGNDWGIMNPPLILTAQQIRELGQQQNWLGGLNITALKDAENNALLFSEWLQEKYSSAEFPLTHLSGPGGPIPTESGLSMYPYIREGRRIMGRAAYGQSEFFMREQDIRIDMDGRDFSKTIIGITHYAIDMHGCRYRNWEPSKAPSSAPANEDKVRPIFIPYEALIPQRIDNLFIGNKGIAVSHIVNGATRIHVGEWSVGAASGAAAAWILQHEQSDLTTQGVLDKGVLPDLQKHLRSQGLLLDW